MSALTYLRAARRNPPLLVLWGVSSHAARRNGHALSADQERALEILLPQLLSAAQVTLVLAGPAGTGKTTLMRALIDRLQEAGIDVVLLAPTGKAAARLKEATGLPTGTVHSFIYKTPESAGYCAACKALSLELGQAPRALRREGIESVDCPHCGEEYDLRGLERLQKEKVFASRDLNPDGMAKKTVVIIDEASMVDEKMSLHIKQTLPRNFSVLYVGDKEQLPPVNGCWGADFDHPTAELTQIHRQAADNPIVDLATRIRRDENLEDRFAFNAELDAHLPSSGKRIIVAKNQTFQQVARWLAGGRKKGLDGTLITHSNKDRVLLNTLVREALGHPERATQLFHKRRLDLPWTFDGKKKVRKEDYPVAGDRLLILANNRAADLYNGEVMEVEESRLPESDEMVKRGLVFVTLKGRSQEFLIWVGYLNAIPLTSTVVGDDFRALMGSPQSRGGAAEKSRMMLRVDEDGAPFDERYYADAHDLTAEELFEQYNTVRDSDLLLVDYGETITAHKSQGSQWNTVGVVWRDYQNKLWKREDKYEDTRRWLYTAVTRAKTRVVIFEIS